MTTPRSVLDLAPVTPGATISSSLHRCVDLAQTAETHGYRRVWYAEHHNMPAIASAATAVLIAHVAAHTQTIRLGAAGVMLPNHAPLVIAEQFGTLAELHPGRIDLGVGRAPGTDQRTLQALRRTPDAAVTFPRDVQELLGFLGDESAVEGVHAIPGRGTHVPVTILGSSLAGAQLAAALGLPYAFASHFAPAALTEAITLYRTNYRPSATHPEPFVLAGINAIATTSADEAESHFAAARRAWARRILRGGHALDDVELDAALLGPAGHAVEERFTHTALGDADTARHTLEAFATQTGVDEVIVVPTAIDPAVRGTTIELLAPTEPHDQW
ncbi:MAG: LLM class flavin-dependent oxidoreductase [Nitriliruptoraceae bacterium]